MKKLTILLLLALPLFISSCDKNDDVASSNTEQINLNIDKTKLPGNLSITYKAEGTGDGKMTQLKYLDDKGVQQTVSSPSLPWTKTFSMAADSSVSMSATGTLSKGSLTITVNGTAQGTTFNLSDSQTRN